ncbi:class I SAM-dependent methyltransferase [Bradyrhizobium sp. DASA03076]|uniref:class I SAM-dependent methyltransferase n=1 Tax=Bradyrhizobium sp. BLXBL-03 TaxID=3395916 RepID=UPI003F7174ED
MKREPRTRCPICEEPEFRSKLRVTRHNENFEIVECGACGFTFVADPPTDTANHVDINKIDWAFRPRHNQIRRLILKHIKPGGRVLEIGCGRGEVGYLLRHDPVRYQGYEPAHGLSDFGIRAGVPIHQRIYSGGEKADVVVIDNVLEHVAEPAALIKTAAESLTPGGLLIVITPNRDDVRAALSTAWREKYLWVPPDHINFFSATDINAIFAQIGMRPERFKFAPLTLSDWKFVPRATAESLGLSIFGHNLFATKA